MLYIIVPLRRLKLESAARRVLHDLVQLLLLGQVQPYGSRGPITRARDRLGQHYGGRRPSEAATRSSSRTMTAIASCALATPKSRIWPAWQAYPHVIALARSSSTSRVLPIPGSPRTHTACPARVSSTASSAPASWRISFWHPTNGPRSNAALAPTRNDIAQARPDGPDTQRVISACPMAHAEVTFVRLNHRQVADLVDDEQAVARQIAHALAQSVLALGAS